MRFDTNFSLEVVVCEHEQVNAKHKHEKVLNEVKICLRKTRMKKSRLIVT